ncbi:Benzaldehyde dehydrogenase [Nitrospirillum viridazoti Y2]|uniref:Benzaldehyde dehydrogenase (NAD+) n=1 Tax=Nitrospirillum amazonense TaxID=28077 RepID=A0A560HKD2_9PROT|nr:aldehyde dehydrogenase family protein [Nitrospirillum amazonense]EGY02483.1 Benzaldehyde dehydrogenase [Nitrospirillum amazonense Y2]TWB46962.1 benzaldehyde dehydrogenase (NAD+) [Nitrospirillum amazonense]
MSTGIRLVTPEVWSGQVFDGRWRKAASTISVLEPATGEVLGIVGASEVTALDAIAERALAAQRGWAATPAEERAAIMRHAADLLDRERGEIINLIMRETGGVRGKAETELNGTIGELIHSAALLIAPEGQVLAHPDPSKLSIARRVPLGLVGVITPWNFPMLLAMRSVAPALALGNAVLLKPDPQTSMVGGALLARLFEEAGVPAGVFSVLNGGADIGEGLIALPAVRLVTFTGSTAVGRRVGELASRNLKKVALELGGKSPFIVLDDADLEAAASAGAWGSFLHQGQICMASGRHIVHRKVVDDYLDILTRKAEQLKVGDPFRTEGVAIGPIINSKQLARVDEIVHSSVAAGARLLTGGVSQGPFYRPTVLAGVNPQVPAYHLEIFGPVAPVVVAEDEEDAIRIANDTEYGLSSAVQTGALERGLRVAARINAGMVHINDQTISDLPGIPFGGMGQSGNGSRFGSTTNWEEFTQWRWMTAGATPARYPF